MTGSAYSASSCDAVGAIRCAIAPYEAKIKLELHATWSVGTGMMRSRAASAP
jgi:hypothetical protein